MPCIPCQPQHIIYFSHKTNRHRLSPSSAFSLALLSEFSRYSILRASPPTSPLHLCASSGAQIDNILPYVKHEAQSCSAAFVSLEPIIALPHSSSSSSSVDEIRASRKDKHLYSTNWLLRFARLGLHISGAIPSPSLPPFIMSRQSPSVPATPRVISPSPTPSEQAEPSQEGYL